MLRVLSWNIKTGVGNDPELPDVRMPSDLDRVASIIRDLDPDVVALQEVDRNRDRTGNVDQPAILSRLLEMGCTFGPNLVDDEGEYGVAILTRHPVISNRHDLLPGSAGWEPRGVVEVVVDVAGIGDVSVFNTHLQIAFGEGENEAKRQRERSVSVLAERIQATRRPVILMGDFNCDPGVEDLSGLSILEDAWKSVGDGDGKTFPASPHIDPEIRIDAIFTNERLRPESCAVIRGEATALASDHYPVLAELRTS